MAVISLPNSTKSVDKLWRLCCAVRSLYSTCSPSRPLPRPRARPPPPPPPPAPERHTTLSLVAYSTPTVAFSKLVSAFQATPAGKGIDFQQSYGASEVPAKAVQAGPPADVVDFSPHPDMDSLVKARLVAKNWNKNASNGFVTK